MGMEAESLAAPTLTFHEPQERDFTLECEALITQLFELGRSSAIPGNQKKKKNNLKYYERHKSQQGRPLWWNKLFRLNREKHNLLVKEQLHVGHICSTGEEASY